MHCAVSLTLDQHMQISITYLCSMPNFRLNLCKSACKFTSLCGIIHTTYIACVVQATLDWSNAQLHLCGIIHSTRLLIRQTAMQEKNINSLTSFLDNSMLIKHSLHAKSEQIKDKIRISLSHWAGLSPSAWLIHQNGEVFSREILEYTLLVLDCDQWSIKCHWCLLSTRNMPLYTLKTNWIFVHIKEN